MKYSLFSVLLAIGLLHLVEAHGDVWLVDQEATQKFKDMVQRLHRTLDGTQYQDIGNLRNFIAQANEGLNVRVPDAPIPELAIKRGIAAFMRQRTGSFASSKEGKEQYDEKFGKIVIGTCDVIDHEVNSIERAYHRILHSSDTIAQLDMDSLEWLTNIRICLDILGDKKSFNKGSFEALIGKKYHRSVLGRIIHKLIDRRRR